MMPACAQGSASISELLAAAQVRARLIHNDVPDAYDAAIALEQGATVVTADRGFGRFGAKTLVPTAD
ncbi:hypothetical protein [Agrococcus sp. TF02-05]|uniref:hypothetical protein n=1 Tax=Agrococcus sp. TF02-05 TaxID=2815211 RepID=UPI001AA1220F|nr:hypothetical protein [Agrococcus sp. TF02-05]MBO1769507.1 hypothetical protein [Agrococcus sp. TF02-05]